MKSGNNSLKIPMKSNKQNLPIIAKEEPQKNSNNTNLTGNSASNAAPNNNNNQNPAPVQTQVGGGNARPTSSKNIMIIVFDAVTNLPLANVNITVYKENSFLHKYLFNLFLPRFFTVVFFIIHFAFSLNFS